MSPLVVPYGFNILVLVPVGLLTLLGGATGNRWVFHGKFPESAGVRTILGSLWTAILTGSCLGLYFPTRMAPLLLIQILYKSLWLVVFVVPRWLTGRAREVPWLGRHRDVCRHRGELSVGDPVGAVIRPTLIS